MDANTQRRTVDLADIRTDGDTQSRAALNESTIAEYAEALESGVNIPPVIVFHDGAAYWLADGFHRHAGAVRAGLSAIAAEVRRGTKRDALLFSVGANATHGLRR